MAKVQDSYYFDTFSACAEDACRAAHLLEAMMQNFQPANIRQELDEIHKIEHSADEKKHELQSVLVKAFITPIEREDIATLSGNIDDVIDKIEDVLQRIYCNNIQSIRPDALEMAQKVIQCCEEVKLLVKELADFKHSKTLHDHVVRINDLEEQGDRCSWPACASCTRTAPTPSKSSPGARCTTTWKAAWTPANMWPTQWSAS